MSQNGQTHFRHSICCKIFFLFFPISLGDTHGNNSTVRGHRFLGYPRQLRSSSVVIITQWTLVLTNSEETDKFCSIKRGFVKYKLLKKSLENEEKLFFDSFIHSKQISHLHKFIMAWKMYRFLSAVSLTIKFSQKVH